MSFDEENANDFRQCGAGSCPVDQDYPFAEGRPQDAFAVVSRKYFDGGNTPARVSSRPTSLRISSAQSAQVS
jgi:hypothetical protein